jgi:hypothetical protein
LRVILPSDQVLQKNFFAYIICLLCFTCPTNLILLDLIIIKRAHKFSESKCFLLLILIIMALQKMYS